MYDVAEEFREEGRVEGRIEGREEIQRLTVCNLARHDMNEDFIVEVTGANIVSVRQWIREIETN